MDFRAFKDQRVQIVLGSLLTAEKDAPKWFWLISGENKHFSMQMAVSLIKIPLLNKNHSLIILIFQ